MINSRRKAEKEVWNTIKPFLDLPSTTVNGENSREGMRRYMNARNLIAESVKDPVFVKRFQERKASVRELLTQDFPQDTFAKLFDTDMRALVLNRDKRNR